MYGGVGGSVVEEEEEGGEGMLGLELVGRQGVSIRLKKAATRCTE